MYIYIHSFIPHVFFGHLSYARPCSDFGDTAVKRKPLSLSVLTHRRVFSIVVLCFFKKMLVPVFQSRSPSNMGLSRALQWATSLHTKRAHILRCQQSLCSCTTQQSCKWTQMQYILQEASGIGSASSLLPESGAHLPNGSNDPHLMVFMPLCNILSHCIRAGLRNQQKMAEVTLHDFQGHKNTATSDSFLELLILGSQ